MRLIDADALIPIMKYTTTDNEIGVFPIRIGFDAIKEVIDEASTIDAVVVVRCKDCKYSFYDKDYESYNCRKHEYVECFDADDYCSWGERND